MSRYKTKRNKPAIDLSSMQVSFVPMKNDSDNSFLASQELEDFTARLHYLGSRIGRPNSNLMNGAFDE